MVQRGDVQEIMLLNTSYRPLRTLQRGIASDGTWEPVRYDLTAQAGQDVVIYLNVYNDGDGRRT